MKVPGIFIILLMFTYRYFFVFVEESHRMKLARKSKGFHGGKHLFDKIGMRTISFTAGMILIRAYRRGVRIYDALLVRGFDGKVRTLTQLKITFLDIILVITLIFAGSILLYHDWLVMV
jgi:cobalt/nickel transport system permease protein